MQSIGPALASGYRYRVDYSDLDTRDYRAPTGRGTIEAKIVILAVGFS